MQVLTRMHTYLRTYINHTYIIDRYITLHSIRSITSYHIALLYTTLHSLGLHYIPYHNHSIRYNTYTIIYSFTPHGLKFLEHFAQFLMNRYSTQVLRIQVAGVTNSPDARPEWLEYWFSVSSRIVSDFSLCVLSCQDQILISGCDSDMSFW